jgi:predicted transcriptional regulator
MAEILKLAREDQKMTHLMYQTYISYPMVRDYLQFMVNRGLLDYDKENQVYRITQSGVDFLKQLKKLEV